MEIKNLSFKYPKGKRKIFENLNWKLDTKNVHFIIGGNGVGKTTFYEIITGLLDYEGTINNKIESRDILLQLQGVPMLKTMKGKDLAELILGGDDNFDENSFNTIKTALSEKSHEKLGYLWESHYGNMSVGEGRWFLIYLFSLLDRELYIFDEPTAGLDIQSAKEVLKIIENLSINKNKKVLLTTHNMQEIEYFKNYTITFFHKGYNYFTGSKREFNKIIESKFNDYEELGLFLNSDKF